MLIEFKVTNFKSFKEQQTFSMVSGPDRKLEENTTKKDASSLRLLNSAVIYGANASGKSNLLNAMLFVKSLVSNPVDRQGEYIKYVQPFKLDLSCSVAMTEFEIHFFCENIRYQYGFCLNSKQIYKEWLIAYPKGKPQKWFERVYEETKQTFNWSFGAKLLGEKVKLQDLTKPDVLYLSVAAAFNNEQLTIVSNWFRNKFQFIVDLNFRSFNFYTDFTAIQSMIRPDISNSIKKLVGYADLGIVDFSVKEEISDENDKLLTEDTEKRKKKRVIRVTFKHSHSGNVNSEASFELEEESLGTRRLFSLAGPILDTLERGITLVIDEFDSSLHPILVKNLVKLFHDPEINKLGAQLIFNTHDTTLLDTDLFRRDQIWLVEKDEAGASKIYSLLEFSPRASEALQKGYLQGRYGGIPFIEDPLLGLAANA